MPLLFTLKNQEQLAKTMSVSHFSLSWPRKPTGQAVVLLYSGIDKPVTNTDLSSASVRYIRTSFTTIQQCAKCTVLKFVEISP